jgi:glycolate oxidase
VTGDGTILSLGRRTAKGVTGYDLTALLVGSEGTLGIVTEATLKLIPRPEAIATLLVFLPNDAAIERAVTAAIKRRLRPRCVELLDATTLDIMRAAGAFSIPDGAKAMLLIELDGELDALDHQLELCGTSMEEAGAMEILVAKNATEREKLWSVRRDMSHALRRLAKHKLSEDVVVPRTRLSELLERCRRIAGRARIHMPSYGHAGDGNLHVNYLWDDDEQAQRVDQAIRDTLNAVLEMGGTLSGEHGIGVMKAPYLPLEQSPAIIALEERLKSLFDPKGILNPGKIFPAAAKRFHGVC